MKLKLSVLALAAASLGLPIAEVHAQTFNFTTGTQSWNVAGNWTPSGIPNAIGASATFNSPTGTQGVNLSAAITAGSITLTNNTTNVFTLANGTGGSLTLNKDGSGSGEAAITLNGTSVTTNNLTISASVAMNDTTRVVVNQTGATGTAVGTFTGALTGSGNFIKDGLGRLSFTTASKAYTGSTTIEAGRLSVSSAGAPTGTSAVEVKNGGMLMLNSAATWNIGGGTAVITLNGSGTGESNQGAGALRANTSGLNALANPVVIQSDATVHIDGGSSITTLSGAVSGTGILNKSGGGNITLTNANAGYSGGTTLLNGSITVNSGSKLGAGALTFGQTLDNNTTVTLNNSSQSIGSLSTTWTNVTGTNAQTLALNGTALTINQTTGGTFGNGAVSTLTGVITGSGSIIKQGSATLILDGTNTYNGTTSVNNGKLVINGSISTSVTTVNNGGALGGVGTVGALTVKSGGTLAPGSSPGILNAGATTLEAGSTLGIEIDGATIGAQYDQLNVTGTFSLAGLLSITMGSYSPTDGDLFFIVANDGTEDISGVFSNASANGNTYSFDGQDFKISYFGNQTSPGVGTFTGGNDIVLMAIPEPSAALLGGVGMLVLLCRRRF